MRKRRRTFIDARLQGKFILAFMGVGAACLVLFATSLSITMSGMMNELPYESQMLSSGVRLVLWQKLWLSMVAAVPMSIGVGTLLTFRIAGPLYRFRRFLEAVERGERPGDCKIREKDELHEFCELLNRVTKPLREPVHADATDEGEDQDQDGGHADAQALPRPLDRRQSA